MSDIKYLDPEGIKFIWEEIKNRILIASNKTDTLKSNIEQGTVVANKATNDAEGTPITAYAKKTELNNQTQRIDTLNGYFSNGIAKKATSDGNGNVISSTYATLALLGIANGIATLDTSGKVPASQLPSFVDDVIEGYYYNSKFYSNASHTTELSGEGGKIYVDLSTNKTYRFGGTTYAVISDNIALGITAGTAYEGSAGNALKARTDNIESAIAMFLPETITSGNYTSQLYHSGTTIELSITNNLTGETTMISSTGSQVVIGYGNSDKTSVLKIDEGGIEIGVDGVNTKTFKLAPTGITINGNNIVDSSMVLTNEELKTLLGITE